MYPKKVSEVVSIISHQHGCPSMSKDDINRRAKVDEEKFMRPQPNLKIYRQLRNTESSRNSLPQGKGHKSTIQYQMITPENTHVHNIMQIQMVIVRTYVRCGKCQCSNVSKNLKKIK